MHASLLEQLSTHKATFFFLERDRIASEGSWSLISQAAKWFQKGDLESPLPDAMPVWQGSVLPHREALNRFALPHVWAITIGCPSAEQRRALVANIRANPPVGLFDHDAKSDSDKLPLVITGFLMPNSYLRIAGEARRFDRQTGLDMIGLSDDERSTLDYALEFAPSLLSETLLVLLTRTAAYRLNNAGVSDSYEDLIDHAFQLFHLGTYGAAGVVAGVAFERLMRSALVGDDRQWLALQTAAGKHVALNNVIAKVASKRGISATRLHRYRELRNDLAHRLGHDDTRSVDEEDAIASLVSELLDWLAKQTIDADGSAELIDTEERPNLTDEQIYKLAWDAGEAASDAIKVVKFSVDGTAFEPFGFAQVSVRPRSHPFVRWLLRDRAATSITNGALIHAPCDSFERNLVWAAAVTTSLRNLGLDASYEGRPD